MRTGAGVPRSPLDRRVPAVARRPRRTGERGLFRRLIVGVSILLSLVLISALGAVVVLAILVTRSPDLGAGPQGPNDGDNESQLAIFSAQQVARQFLTLHAHVTVTLSEQDITVEVRTHAGDSGGQFTDPTARVRNGLLVVDGQTSLGPLGVRGVGRFTVRMIQGSDGQPDIRLDLQEVDAGTVTLPGALRDAIAGQVSSRARIDGLLRAGPLGAVRGQLECVRVVSTGIVVGFHAPGFGADATTCSSA